MQTERHDLTYGRLARFFLPLGAMPLLIASTHTIMDAALARLPAPEVSLAIFAIVKMLMNAVKAPDVMTRQAATTLIDDRHSLRSVSVFAWSLCFVLLALLIPLAYTPAGGWVLRNVIGLQDPDQIALAYSGMRIAAFLPIVEIFRNHIQGIAIGLERTNILAVGTTTRLIGVTLFLMWIVNTRMLGGVVATSVAWTIGIGVEGVVVFAYLLRRFGSLSDAAEHMPARNDTSLTLLDIATFFAPLALMMSLTAWLQPIIQSGLARSVSPTRSLAAYGVAWGLVFLITGPVRIAYQCALVYVNSLSDPNWPIVRRFCLLVGVAGAGIVLLLGLSPVGTWLLRDVIAVPAPVVDIVRPTMVAFSLFPIIRAWREAYWGVLLNNRDTRMIGGAKVANLIAVVGMLVLAFGVLQAGVVVLPPVVAALAYTVGDAVESVIIWRYSVRHAG